MSIHSTSDHSDYKELVNPVEGVPIDDIPHDDSTCPHIKPRRYCGGRLSRGSFCAIVVTSVLIAVGLIIFGIIYALGRSYAKTAINDSDIVFSMEMFDPTADGFGVRILGSIDNRNILDATLFPTTISLSCLGQLFGKMPFPEIHLQGGALTPLNLTSHVTITDTNAFNGFASTLLSADEVTLTMTSEVSVQAAGMKYNSVAFNKDMTIRGIDQFSDPPVQVLNQIIFKGEPNTLFIALNVSMDNRSPVSIDNMGVLNFSMIVDGIPVGYAVSDGNFSMGMGVGVSNWVAQISRTPENNYQIDQLIASYSAGNIQNVTLRGHANSTTIPSMREPVSHIQINTTLQGLTHLEDKLVQVVFSFQNVSVFDPATDPVGCAYNDTLPPISTQYQDVFMYIHNPLAAPVLMNNSDFNVWWTAQHTTATSFLAHARSRNQNTIIPPGGTIIQRQRLCLSSNPAFVAGLMAYLAENHIDTSGVIPWDMTSLINGTINGAMQDFPTFFNYSQSFITVAQTKINW